MTNDSKLEISEQRYRRLFETAQDGIIILDIGTGKIFDANPFLLEMIGYRLEELRGRELWNIGSFKNIEKAKNISKDLQNKGYVRYENLPLENKDKKIMEVEFICNTYQVGDQKVAQCNIRDIGKRVLATKILAEHTVRIEKLNSLMVGREIRMTELKKEIKILKEKNDKLVKILTDKE